MIRVVLADDHAVMRRGIREILEGDTEVEVVGEAGDGREAIRLAQKLKPDVMIVDLGMPELTGWMRSGTFGESVLRLSCWSSPCMILRS